MNFPQKTLIAILRIVDSKKNEGEITADVLTSLAGGLEAGEISLETAKVPKKKATVRVSAELKAKNTQATTYAKLAKARAALARAYLRAGYLHEAQRHANKVEEFVIRADKLNAEITSKLNALKLP